MKRIRLNIEPGPDAFTAVYLRVSTAGQKDDSQVYEVERYVKAQGLPAVHYYRDTASGANLDRPEFERLQRDVFSGQVRAVIVWKLDRLARSLRDGIDCLCDWLARNVHVVSVSQQLDFNGATGKLIAAVLLAVAEMERETIRERVRAGIAARQAKGLPMGRRPGQCPKWSLAKRKIDPAMAASLKTQGVPVKDIAAKFGCTRQAVSGVLNELK